MSQPTKKLNKQFNKQFNKQSNKPTASRNKRQIHKNRKSAHPKPQTKPDLPIVTVTIDNLLHDGRGVGIYSPEITEHPSEKHGKKVFVNFALPNETVSVKINKAKKSFEEGDCIEVIANPSPQRAEPICQHFGTCGGCSLQHWQADEQIRFKQSVLADMLIHQAGITPDNWLEPIVAEQTGYRTKARIGVRYLHHQGRTVFGFREQASNRLTNINDCPILDKRINEHLQALKSLINSLDKADSISHIEVAAGEEMASLEMLTNLKNLTNTDVSNENPPKKDLPIASIALIIRHLKPFNKADLSKLQAFSKQRNWQIYLQGNKHSGIIHDVFSPPISNKQDLNKKPDTSQQKPSARLYYQLPKFNLTYEFFPTDFTQVNLSVNRQMVSLACKLLDLQTGERVLDLFSGLGNFSLAMAKQVGGDDGSQGLVIGVEGSEEMTQRATDNAKLNGLINTKFYTHDLTQDLSQTDWANADDLDTHTLHNSSNKGFDALLIDPPRAGAWEIMQYIPKFNANRIVYVSCNPATLARDSKSLIEAGYRMTHAGVMDMFCHTSHVESIARFEKIG